MITKIKEFLKKNFTSHDCLFIAGILVLFSLLRFPSLFEPYWYGDEGIYEVIGMALRSGRVLYSQIWDNKPPILYLIYALVNGDLFYARLLSFFAGFFAVLIFFLIAKKLFKNYLSIIFSTLFFSLMFATPIIEGNIANAENFMLLPTLLAFYLLFCVESKKYILKTAIAGILLSISFLTKIVAIFDLAAFMVILLSLRFFDTVYFDKKHIVRELKRAFLEMGEEAVLFISFLIPIILTFIYFAIRGALPDFVRASFFSNVGYVGYGNYFLFPMGFLILKLLLLAVSILLVFRFRKFLGRSGFIIFIWVAFALFDTFFSNRPYTHYLLVLLPSVSLLFGLTFENKNILKVTIPALIIIYLLVNSNFKFYKRLVPYYKNYVTFLSGGPITTYQNFFDPNTSRDYDVANFVKLKADSNQGIFLWGDGAQIYALSGKLPPGRYTAAYHITSSKDAIAETKTALENSNTQFIIQTKDDDAISNFLDGYDLKYKVDDATIYEKQP